MSAGSTYDAGQSTVLVEGFDDCSSSGGRGSVHSDNVNILSALSKEVCSPSTGRAGVGVANRGCINSNVRVRQSRRCSHSAPLSVVSVSVGTR